MDSDLAVLYEVPTRTFNQAVRRNRSRFPEDFMFELTAGEASALRSQIVILKPGRGRHSKYLPLAFTEHGVAMLSAVLRSTLAVRTSIMIVRTFVRMRELIASNRELALRVEKLETSQSNTASVIEHLANEIDGIAHELKKMKAIPASSKRRIGFAMAADGGR